MGLNPRILKFTGKIEVKKLFDSLGYHWELHDDEITVNPEIWNLDVSAALDMSKNVSYKVEGLLDMKGINTQKVFSLLQPLFTPIKGRELVGALFNGISVIIIAIIMWHLFTFQFNLGNIVAITISSASLLYLIAACIQSASNILKSDQELFIKRYGFSLVNDKYVIGYKTVLKQIVRRKVRLIIISSILLTIFLLGIFTDSPMIIYLSGIFDLMGYLFALFFLLGQGLRGKRVKETNKSVSQRYLPFVANDVFVVN